MQPEINSSEEQEAVEFLKHWGELVEKYWRSFGARLINVIYWAHLVTPDFINVFLCD